jgi:hypothetical protein
MTNPIESPQSITIIRGLLVALLITYSSALCVEWNPQRLSTEAAQYQQLVHLSMSGFSLKFMLQKTFWLIGNVFGVFGLILMFIRSKRGTLPLLLCPLLLTIAALLGAAPAAYPNIEGETAMLLWCATSAIWGCVVVYALLLGNQLSSKNTTGKGREAP